MSTFNKRFVLGLIFILIFIPSSYLNTSESRDQALRTSKTSSRLVIDGNNDWAILRLYGTCSGSGTASDPYVLADLEISGYSSNTCIEVVNSDVYFLIQNCTLSNSAVGIQLYNVQNGRIDGNYIFSNDAGILLYASSSITINNNQLYNNPNDGISLSECENSKISNNYVSDSESGIRLDLSNNNQVTGNSLESNIHGINSWIMKNNQITGNTFNSNNVGINIGEESSCNTISDNQFINNNVNIEGEQEECPLLPLPFPFPFLLLIGVIIGVLGILIISIFIIIRRRKTFRKGETIEIREKPSSLKPKLDLQADKVELQGEIIEEVKPIPSIGIKEVEITSEDFKPMPYLPPEEISKIEEPATETPKEVLDKSAISLETDKVEEIEIQENIIEEVKEELQSEDQEVEEVETTEVMEISDIINMPQSNIKLKLNGNAEAVFAFPNKKKEFYIDLFNMSSNYLSQAKIKIEGPPEVKLLVKFEWYGKVAPGKSKRRLFIIIPKEEGKFQLTAYLTSNKKPVIDTSFEVRVGKVDMPQEVSKPSMAPTKAETIKKTNCPFCDKLINSDASFCPHCGSNIKRKLEKSQKDVKDTKFCVKCGTEHPSQAKFCIKCGSKLEY